MSLQDHYENQTIGGLTFMDVKQEELSDLVAILNEPLEREGYAVIIEIEQDGCEDINVKMADGKIIQVCMETTMDEIWTEAGLPE